MCTEISERTKRFSTHRFDGITVHTDKYRQSIGVLQEINLIHFSLKLSALIEFDKSAVQSRL